MVSANHMAIKFFVADLGEQKAAQLEAEMCKVILFTVLSYFTFFLFFQHFGMHNTVLSHHIMPLYRVDGLDTYNNTLTSSAVTTAFLG